MNSLIQLVHNEFGVNTIIGNDFSAYSTSENTIYVSETEYHNFIKRDVDHELALKSILIHEVGHVIDFREGNINTFLYNISWKYRIVVEIVGCVKGMRWATVNGVSFDAYAVCCGLTENCNVTLEDILSLMNVGDIVKGAEQIANASGNTVYSGIAA